MQPIIRAAIIASTCNPDPVYRVPAALHLNSPGLLLAAWLGFVAATASAQTGVTNANASAPGISANTNSEPKVQDPRALAQRAEQLRTACVDSRRRICGQVVQVKPGGLVVDSGYTDLLRPELSRSWVAPGTVSATRPANLIEEKTPGSPCVGLVFLADIPKRPAVKLYDYVIIEAYPAGEYVYEAVPTVTKTVRRFSAQLETAVDWNLASEKK
jgi:hypothetical protein